MSDVHSNGNGGHKRASLAELAEKHSKSAVLAFLARWSMVTVVPGMLTVLVAVSIFAGSRLLSQFEKMGERLEKISERQEEQGRAASKAEMQVKLLAETQLPAVTAMLNDRMSTQGDRIYRIEKLVDEEFRNLKLQDMKQNEKLEALLERLYKFRQQLIQPQSGPRTNLDMLPSPVPGQL